MIAEELVRRREHDFEILCFCKLGKHPVGGPFQREGRPRQLGSLQHAQEGAGFSGEAFAGRS